MAPLVILLGFFFFCDENYGLTLWLPTSMPISTGSTSHGQAENTYHWPATVSMETTVSFPSWESINSDWTWDDSYKLFSNLVIFHFHAGMDIGLQVCREWREEVFMLWHFSGGDGMAQYGPSSSADVLWNAHENLQFSDCMRLKRKRDPHFSIKSNSIIILCMIFLRAAFCLLFYKVTIKCRRKSDIQTKWWKMFLSVGRYDPDFSTTCISDMRTYEHLQLSSWSDEPELSKMS